MRVGIPVTARCQPAASGVSSRYRPEKGERRGAFLAGSASPLALIAGLMSLALAMPASAQAPEGAANDLYGMWAGEDGQLTVQEWDAAVDARFGEQAVNLAVAEWDSDGNGIVSREEFTQAVAQSDVFAQILQEQSAVAQAAAPADPDLARGIEAELKNQHSDLTSAITSDAVKQGLKLAWSIETDKHVSHTPLVHRGNVYFADWGGFVYKADLKTGEVAWKKKVQETVQDKWPWHGFAGTGAIAEPEGILFEASTEGWAYGIDAESGEVLWKTKIAEDPQAGSISKNLYYDGLFYTGLQSVEEPLSKKLPPEEINFQGKVLALDAKTGKIVWERPLVTPPHNGVAVWSSFALDPVLGTLFFTTGNNYTGEATELSDALVAVDAKTGEIKWHRQVTMHDVWTMADPKGPDYDFGAGPQLFEATIEGQPRQLVGAGQKSGVFYVWDRVTGEPIWTHTVGYGHVGGGMHGEGSIGDGMVILWGNNAYPYSNPEQHPMDITAVDAATGTALWTKPKAQPAVEISAGFLANDVYFVGSLDGKVRAYRAKDGQHLWTSQQHGSVASSIWVEDGTVLWGAGVPKNFGGREGPSGVFAYSTGQASQ